MVEREKPRRLPARVGQPGKAGTTANAKPAKRAPPKSRKEPAQSRGEKRVESILDAAEAEFAEVGYDAATTERIAKRASASIGSVYQFFPNKRAIFDAIAKRHLTLVREVFDRLMANAGAPGTDGFSLVDTFVDAYWKLQCDAPAFRAVWFQGALSAELLGAAGEVNATFVEKLGALAGSFLPGMSPAEIKDVLTVAVETVSAMLFYAAKKPRAHATRVIRETKRMLSAYLLARATGAV